ncbi:tetratricopeptide repeat protein [Amycolatopsis australiensis]|uniref:Tfp pilus assembly protein PilF n=1 Tax=Amycolatopsis australiensis TaxID=546364 RepID=A0A1K1RW99_9PSEU|nr:tetratricopeptide repeat protein [Amycolatopsis australiensis]SFW76101.1 Tfp pilus assembly protein PilF [Amycolatopsis australiensis]
MDEPANQPTTATGGPGGHNRIPGPVQLPAATGDLVGRDDVFAQLDDVWARRDARRPLVVLNGIGGVGKTAVAVHWLSRRRAEFPGGLLYAPLTDADSSPARPEDVLHGFLTALGVAAGDIPSGPLGRSGVFRTVTAGRTLAVLLDDAVSAAQVRTLLPATSSVLVVVTSRRRLAGLGIDDATLVDVAPLDEARSSQLLGSVVGLERLAAEPAAVRSIVSTCGGLPLALGVVAARLRARPLRRLEREARTYDRYLREAGPLPEDVQDVQAVFDAAYAELPSGAARLYRVCGLHPGPEVGLETLIAVLDAPAERIEDEVETLVDANLLADADHDRVKQHEVLRRDARIRAEREDTSADRQTIARGFARWYLARAQLADDLIHPHRPRFARSPAASPSFRDRAAAVAWWRRELPTLRATFTEATRNGWDEEVWQFCEAAWGYFLHHRDYDAWLPMSVAGVAAARRCGHPLVEARLRAQLGFAYAKLHRYEEAVTQNLAALRLGEQVGDEQTRATALSQLGRAARGRGDLNGALGFYRQAVALQAQLGNDRGVALGRRRCGEVMAKQGRTAEAIVELEAAANSMAELGDANQHARALMTLASIRVRDGDYAVARRMLSAGLEAVRRLGSPYYTAELLAALGRLELDRGHDKEARHHFAEARELYAAIGDPRAAELPTATGE